MTLEWKQIAIKLSSLSLMLEYVYLILHAPLSADANFHYSFEPPHKSLIVFVCLSKYYGAE